MGQSRIWYFKSGVWKQYFFCILLMNSNLVSLVVHENKDEDFYLSEYPFHEFIFQLIYVFCSWEKTEKCTFYMEQEKCFRFFEVNNRFFFFNVQFIVKNDKFFEFRIEINSLPDYGSLDFRSCNAFTVLYAFCQKIFISLFQ